MMKQQFKMEYVFTNISSNILWTLISTPQGLSKWYSEKCEVENNRYTFLWSGMSEVANLVKFRNGENIRFHREEDDDHTFFEFQIHVNPLTKDVTLTIIDFADKDEIDDVKMLWDKQIDELRKSSGI